MPQIIVHASNVIVPASLLATKKLSHHLGDLHDKRQGHMPPFMFLNHICVSLSSRLDCCQNAPMRHTMPVHAGIFPSHSRGVFVICPW